jgi:hypothetical protein
MRALLLVAATVYVLASPAFAQCPAGWTKYTDNGEEGFRDSCLRVITTTSNWALASAACSASATGAHLLTIKSSITKDATPSNPLYLAALQVATGACTKASAHWLTHGEGASKFGLFSRARWTCGPGSRLRRPSHTSSPHSAPLTRTRYTHNCVVHITACCAKMLCPVTTCNVAR